MTGSWWLGLSRVIPYLLFTVVLMPVQAVALAVAPSLAARIPRFYHRRVMRLFGFRIVVRGTPSAVRPTLFVSNHTSYFDIEVLASLLDVSFIAKSDMMDWPFFGWLAKLQRSVFVDRRPSNVGEHTNQVAARLAAGDNLVLFAEGTTSDGNRLLPFKSALFSVAEQAAPDRPVVIQPVSIMATALDGMPLGRFLRPLYAWYGDMPLLSHAWEALKLGHITVVVEFHEPFAASGLARKELAARSRAEVAEGVERAISGRFDQPEPPHHDDDDAEAEAGEDIDAAA
jgi:1-acyl-sn-glycerol-3-phosphate acyltransferase